MKIKIGENIRALRKERALSQTNLAKLLNTTQDTVSLWELGKSYPNLVELVCLSEIFNVTTDFLLGLSEY